MCEQDVALRQGPDIPLRVRPAWRQAGVGVADRLKMRQQGARGPLSDAVCKIRDNRHHHRDNVLRRGRAYLAKRVHCDRHFGEQGSATDVRVQQHGNLTLKR